MMKNTHGLNRWVVFDDILRLLIIFPLSFSHTILLRPPSYSEDENPSQLNTHIRNIHAWFSLLPSSRYIFAHFTSLPCPSSSYFLPFCRHLVRARALDDKYIRPHRPTLDAFPSFDLNILDKRRQKEQRAEPLSHYRMHGHTRARLLMIYFMATLVSHGAFIISNLTKTCFSFKVFAHCSRLPDTERGYFALFRRPTFFQLPEDWRISRILKDIFGDLF